MWEEIRKRLANDQDAYKKLKHGALVGFVNPATVEALHKEEISLSELDVIYSDSALCSRFFGFVFGEKVLRVSFDYSSIADDFFRWCSRGGLSVAIVGSTDTGLERAIDYLRKRHEGLVISNASRNGFFASEAEIVEYVRGLEVDVVVCGMGAPRQERFLHLLKRECGGFKLAITCGGFVTQTGMRGDFYLPIVKRLGVRWLQRFLFEPHVVVRTARTYPVFFAKGLNWWMQKRLAKIVG